MAYSSGEPRYRLIAKGLGIDFERLVSPSSGTHKESAS